MPQYAVARYFVLIHPRKIEIVDAQNRIVIFGKYTIRRRTLFCAYSSEKN
jgi:hypothetical protein